MTPKHRTCAIDTLFISFLDRAMTIADLLRKHGGKTGEELKAEGIDNPDYQSKPY